MEEPRVVYDNLVCQCEGNRHRFATGLPEIGETCACGKIVVDELMYKRWIELASNEIGWSTDAYL